VSWSSGDVFRTCPTTRRCKVDNHTPRSHYPEHKHNKGSTHSINLPQIPSPRKMQRQTRLRTPRTNSTTSPQHSTRTQYRYPCRLRKRRGQAIKHHGRVVEDISKKTVHFAFWFQRGAETVREEYCGEAAGGVLEHGEEEGVGGGSEGVAYAYAFWGVRDVVVECLVECIRDNIFRDQCIRED
jgi:hypothetical protein